MTKVSVPSQFEFKPMSIPSQYEARKTRTMHVKRESTMRKYES